MLVHLGLEHAKLVHLSLGGHPQPAVAPSSLLQACPEVGKLVDDSRIVADGSTEVANPVEQLRAVVDGHEVGRLHAHNEVKILHCAVVVAQLHADEAAVVMRKKIVGLVVVGHHAPQVVGVDAAERTVDIAVHVGGLQPDGLREEVVGILPLAFVHRHIGARGPCVGIVGIHFQALVEPKGSLSGVFLLQVDFGLERVGACRFLPSLDDGVGLGQRMVVVLQLKIAQRTVVPVALNRRIQLDGP